MNFKKILFVPMLILSNHAWGAECKAPSLELPNGQWKQISLPCEPPTTYGEKIISGGFFGDKLPVAGFDTTWVLFLYDTSKNTYRRVGLGEPVEQGKGYWIIQKTGTHVSFDMPAGSENKVIDKASECGPPSTKCYGISLETAPKVQWNMIGTPFDGSGVPAVPTAFPVKDVLVSVGTGNGECGEFTIGCGLEKAKSLNFAHDTLFRWNGVDKKYDRLTATNGGTLQAWDGFWIAALGGADKQTSKVRYKFSLPFKN